MLTNVSMYFIKNDGEVLIVHLIMYRAALSH